jgi:hypothetical protein
VVANGGQDIEVGVIGRQGMTGLSVVLDGDRNNPPGLAFGGQGSISHTEDRARLHQSGCGLRILGQQYAAALVSLRLERVRTSRRRAVLTRSGSTPKNGGDGQR